MIRYENNLVSWLVEWLNQEFEDCPDVDLSVLNGYNSVDGETGSGFAVYIRQGGLKPMILASGDIDKDLLEEVKLEDPTYDEDTYVCECILHEFRHHLQFTSGANKGKTVDELDIDADEFAHIKYGEFSEWLKRHE